MAYRWTFSFFFFCSSGGIIWNYNDQNTSARHTVTQDICFDLIRFHQLCIPLPPLLGIELVTTDAKLYDWANSPYHTEVTPNQLVMVIERPINLNVSCKLHPYSLQNKVETAAQCFCISCENVRRTFWSW